MRSHENGNTAILKKWIKQTCFYDKMVSKDVEMFHKIRKALSKFNQRHLGLIGKSL